MEIDNNIEAENVQTIIISLNQATNSKDALQHVKRLLEHLPKVSLQEVDEKLLKHAMPLIKRNLHKIFEDNILLFDSIDDEIVSVLFAENIQLCLGFIEEIRRIVCCILENEEVELFCICSNFLNVPQCLYLIFEHYQNRRDLYSGKFDNELLHIRNISEELHLLFLKMLESHVVVSKNDNNIKSEEVLVEVLDIICNIADILSDNPKLAIETWKSFATIIQKFNVELGESFNIKLPIQCLVSVINKNLIAVDDLGSTDANSVIQLVKCSSYFLRILLKVCSTFWKCLRCACSDVFVFLCTVYRIPFLFTRYPEEILGFIDDAVFKHMDIFVAKMLQDKELFEGIFKEMQVRNKLQQCPVGAMNLITTILKILPQTTKNGELAISILKFVFSLIDKCEEFFSTGNFYVLTIYVTAVIKEYEIYEATEMLLLENVLQTNPYRAALAIETWALYLENSSIELSDTVVDKWLQHLQKLSFGTFTKTPEQSYVKVFSQKLFKLLPTEQKIHISTKYPPENNIGIWKWVQLKDFPSEQKHFLDNLISSTLGKVKDVENMTSFKDLILLSESLELLSTINPRLCNGLNYFDLLSSVCNIWSINMEEEILKNNIFKYFFICSAKFIRTFGNNLGSSNLNMVLPKLKLMSKTHHETYLYLAFEILPVFLSANLSEPEKAEILRVSEDLGTSLLHHNLDYIIIQQLLELTKQFSGTSQVEILLKTVTNSLSKQDQNALDVCLHGQNNEELICKLFQEMKSFQHKCVEWSRGDVHPLSKKFKLDENVEIYSSSHNLKKPSKKIMNIKTSNAINKAIEECKENNEVWKEDACAQEVIDRLKGEVKCLLNITKTEKLTRKNCTDLRIIVNQLLSLM